MVNTLDGDAQPVPDARKHRWKLHAPFDIYPLPYFPFFRHPHQDKPYRRLRSTGSFPLLSYGWALAVLRTWGYVPTNHMGKLLTITLGCATILWLLDYIVWYQGLERVVRAGRWAGALIGPLASLLADDQRSDWTWSYLCGLVSTMLAFSGVYALAQGRRKRR